MNAIPSFTESSNESEREVNPSLQCASSAHHSSALFNDDYLADETQISSTCLQN